MASIQKQNDYWTVRFNFQNKKYRLKVGSKQKAISTKHRIEDTLVDINYGRLSIPTNVCVKTFIASGGNIQQSLVRPLTLREAIKRFFSASILAESTNKAYRKYCIRFSRFAGEESYVRDFDIHEYLKQRLNQVLPVTLKKELIVLKALFNHASVPMPEYELRSLKTNRCFKAIGQSQNGRCVLLSEDDIDVLRKITRANGSNLIADIVDFVVFTGVRRSEVTRLRKNDIDFANNRLVIRELKRKHGVQTHRFLPIHTELIPVLQKRTNQEFIFTQSVNTISSGFKKAVRNSVFDIPGLGLHSIRHSVASRLIDLGTPVSVVAEVLGHASPVTTLNTYTHAFDFGIRNAISRL